MGRTCAVATAVWLTLGSAAAHAGVAELPASAADDACGPVVIERGGTFSGCYRSADPRVPAVMIKTRQPVHLVQARIEHAGDGIDAEVDRVDLSITDSSFLALDPNTAEPVSQRAVALWRPAAVIIEHNRLLLGHGIWLGSDGDTDTRRLSIRFNVSVDVGRYGHPERPNCCVQFVQLDHLRTPGQIAWNRTLNRAGRSSIEDNLNLYGAEGLSRTRPLEVHHNLIVGAYPAAGAGRHYTGGGIMINDGGGAYVIARRNRVVSTTNYGISIAGGHDSQIVRNRVINDGRDDRGRQVGPPYAVGLAVWDAGETGDVTDVSASRNVSGWLRGSDLTRNDWWTPACDPPRACADNRAVQGRVTAADERRERRRWLLDAAGADHQIGPRSRSVRECRPSSAGRLPAYHRGTS